MQFAGLGVGEKETILCLRYGFASAWLLYAQLLLDSKQGGEKERLAMWAAMAEKKAVLCKEGTTPLVTAEEIERLKNVRDPPVMMFTWISLYIGHLSQAGWIPPMATPTFGR